MVTSTHNWLLFFTNQGRIYRAKGYQLPDASRDAKGQHVANLLAFRPEETIASVLSIPGYDAADYLVLATRSGQVKKTRLSDYDTNRQGGIIAINLAEDDEVIGARLVSIVPSIVRAGRRIGLLFPGTWLPGSPARNPRVSPRRVRTLSRGAGSVFVQVFLLEWRR